jgi:hypothetical protein
MKNKKNKFIFLSILIILISGVVYLHINQNLNSNEGYYESVIVNQDTVEPIIQEKESGFQFPMVFMGVYIESLNPKAKNAVAEAILGYKDGEPLDKDRVITELQLSSGTSLYEFDSVLPHSEDTTFYVTMNTEKNTLETTRVTQVLHSKEEAEEGREQLIQIFEQNYHIVYEDEQYTYLKNRHGDLMIVHLKSMDSNRYELRLDGIFVEEHDSHKG